MDRLLQSFAGGRLLRYWKHFTSPIHASSDIDRYQEVRVLASLLILVLVLMLVGMPSHLLQPETVAGTHLPRLIMHGLNCLFIALCYIFTRHGRTKMALMFFVVSLSVSIYIEAWLLHGTDNYLLLYAMILPVIALSLFRSTLCALVLVGVQFFATLLMPNLNPAGTAVPILPTAFTLALVSLLFLALSNAGRHVQMAYRASIALREARYADLFNSVDDLVVLASRGGSILQVNHSVERLLGWQPGDIVGHCFQEYLHPDDLSLLMQPFVDSLEQWSGERPSSLVEVRVLAKTGDYRWLEFNTTPHVVNGTVTMFTTTGRNIGERKQAEAHRLKRAVEREKWDLLQKFVMSVSHDFRTSLSNIETNRYLIERTLQPEQVEALAPRMDVIRNQVTRLNEQLENLQFMTSLKASHTTSVKMECVIQQVINDLALVAVEKQVKIVTQVEAGVNPVIGGNEYLYRAVRQLVKNGISVSQRGGQIELTLKQIDNCVIVQAHNSGPQILADDLERIFEPFYRIDHARSISQGGIGIGLTLVKMVAETYGGDVTVESSPEHGTSFMLKLPAATSSVMRS